MMGVRDCAPPRLPAAVRRVWIILVSVLLLAGCQVSDGDDGLGGGSTVRGGDGEEGAPGVSYSNSESVAGSKHLTSRKLDLSGVTELAVGAVFVVRVRIGETPQATIWMDDNLADLVDATVRDSRFRLGLKPNVNVRNATLAADVTVRTLDQLTADGASQVTLAPELTHNALGLEVSGAGQITGRLRVEAVVAAASGAGTLALSGSVGRLDLHATGTSELRLSELTVRNLDVVLSGAGCAAVTVSDTLAAQASGASTLRYSGTPRITREQTSGASSIAPEASRSDRCGT